MEAMAEVPEGETRHPNSNSGGKILCYNCWRFGNHLANDCPNPRREKPAEIINPNRRGGRGRGRSRGTNRGGGNTQVNQIDPNSPIDPQIQAAGNNPQVDAAMTSMQRQIDSLTNIVAGQMNSQQYGMMGHEYEYPQFPATNFEYLNYLAGIPVVGIISAIQ